MPTNQPNLWEQLTSEQQDRIIAILVQMLLRNVIAVELAHDPE